MTPSLLTLEIMHYPPIWQSTASNILRQDNGLTTGPHKKEEQICTDKGALAQLSGPVLQVT